MQIKPIVHARRFPHNPLFTPEMLLPSQPGLKVEGVLNPGAFRCGGRVGLIMRVAERPLCAENEVATLIWDEAQNAVKRWVIAKDDPRFRQVDPRGFWYDEVVYLTTMSHLMVVWSDDGGEHFTLDGAIRIFPQGIYEGFGIEDCRVTAIDDTFHLTYTAASQWGIAVGHRSTRDWRHFTAPQLLLPPSNKDCALFPRRIDGRYYMLHRPSAGEIGGNNIWMASSEDLMHWGDHRMVAAVRPGSWDSQRVGCGAQPIETPEGWLEIYHGADEKGRYCLGALLLDPADPFRVLARSVEPFFVPEAEYELHGFHHDCVFTNGHCCEGDRIRLYYGASDRVIGGVDFSLKEILSQCRRA